MRGPVRSRQPRARGLLLAPVLVLAATWVASLSGCATLLPKLEPPRLTLQAVTINAISPTQQQLRLRVHAENPNARAITARLIECTLEVAGARVAQGATTAVVSLPAQGATDFDVDVTADLSQALLLMTSALGHHSVDYRIYGTVHLQGGILSRVPFDQRGRVRL
jgi:LEA14-like dessication related protein